MASQVWKTCGMTMRSESKLILYIYSVQVQVLISEYLWRMTNCQMSRCKALIALRLVENKNRARLTSVLNDATGAEGAIQPLPSHRFLCLTHDNRMASVARPEPA